MAHKYFNKIREIARNQTSEDTNFVKDNDIIKETPEEPQAKCKYTRHIDLAPSIAEQPGIITISKEEN